MPLKPRPDNLPERMIESTIPIVGFTRTLLAAIDRIELGDPMRCDLRTKVEAARKSLADRLQELDALLIADSNLTVSCSEGSCSSFLFTLTTKGISRSYLASRLKIDVFSAVAKA